MSFPETGSLYGQNGKRAWTKREVHFPKRERVNTYVHARERIKKGAPPGSPSVSSVLSGSEQFADLLGCVEVEDGLISGALNEEAEALDLLASFAHVHNREAVLKALCLKCGHRVGCV